MRSFGTAMRTVFESRVLMLSVRSIEKQDSLNFLQIFQRCIVQFPFFHFLSHDSRQKSRRRQQAPTKWNHDIPRRGWLFSEYSGILLGR